MHCRVAILLIAGASLCACDTASVEDPPTDIHFADMAVESDLFLAPPGEYVFRDSSEWNEAAASWWDVVYRCDAGSECYEAPPPRFGFADSLIIAVAYGKVACSYTGGRVERITLKVGTAFVELEPLEELDPKCLAAIHLNHFVRVAQSDLPEGLPVVFE